MPIPVLHNNFSGYSPTFHGSRSPLSSKYSASPAIPETSHISQSISNFTSTMFSSLNNRETNGRKDIERLAHEERNQLLTVFHRTQVEINHQLQKNNLSHLTTLNEKNKLLDLQLAEVTLFEEIQNKESKEFEQIQILANNSLSDLPIYLESVLTRIDQEKETAKLQAPQDRDVTFITFNYPLQSGSKKVSLLDSKEIDLFSKRIDGLLKEIDKERILLNQSRKGIELRIQEAAQLDSQIAFSIKESDKEDSKFTKPLSQPTPTFSLPSPTYQSSQILPQVKDQPSNFDRIINQHLGARTKSKPVDPTSPSHPIKTEIKQTKDTSITTLIRQERTEVANQDISQSDSLNRQPQSETQTQESLQSDCQKNRTRLPIRIQPPISLHTPVRAFSSDNSSFSLTLETPKSPITQTLEKASAPIKRSPATPIKYNPAIPAGLSSTPIRDMLRQKKPVTPSSQKAKGK